MDYIHVTNIEKFQPKYTDGRRLLWVRWDIDAIHDYKISKLTPSQRWLLVGLVSLEVKNQKPLPHDIEWISIQLTYPKSSISRDLLMLQTFDLIVFSCNDLLHKNEVEYESSYPTEQNRTEQTERKSYRAFENALFTAWNLFCDKNSVFSKVREISGKRRAALKHRFKQESFREFEEIFKAIEEQPFCFGDNDRKWRVSFDWLINNDTNYLKVLERKYKNGKTADERLIRSK